MSGGQFVQFDDAPPRAIPKSMSWGRRLMTKEKTLPVRSELAGVLAANSASSLKLGQIGERLGFALSAEFLRQIGIEPAGRDRSAVLYHEADFGRICHALVEHITATSHMHWRAA